MKVLIGSGQGGRKEERQAGGTALPVGLAIAAAV